MRTPNEVREEIMGFLAFSSDAEEERMQGLLTELIFASRALALKTSADAMRHIALGPPPPSMAEREGWKKAVAFLEGEEPDA